jgi:uncharacterized membrane protein
VTGVLSSKVNWLLQYWFSSIRRLGLALLLALVAYLWLPELLGRDTRLLASWDVGVFVYLLLDWLLIINLDAHATREHARLQHQTHHGVFLFVVGAACASVVAIGFMSSSLATLSFWPKAWHLLLSIFALISSWLLIHTVFTFRYAHRFYHIDRGEKAELLFPNDPVPDYLDFAYYSLVVGMTSQVSDVTTNSRAIRRLTLLHGILAFIFNMALLALSINILASAI